jgi:hypothetical protein
LKIVGKFRLSHRVGSSKTFQRRAPRINRVIM